MPLMRTRLCREKDRRVGEVARGQRHVPPFEAYLERTIGNRLCCVVPRFLQLLDICCRDAERLELACEARRGAGRPEARYEPCSHDSLIGVGPHSCAGKGWGAGRRHVVHLFATVPKHETTHCLLHRDLRGGVQLSLSHVVRGKKGEGAVRGLREGTGLGESVCKGQRASPQPSPCRTGRLSPESPQ